MELGLAGRVVVVVGAARGIGEAVARAFLAESAVVAALDRDPAMPEIARQWPRALGITVDATCLAEVKAAAEQAENALGPCDHVVFAVGAGSGKYGFPFWNLEPGDWPRVLEINLIAAVNVAHSFAPRLIQAAARDVAGPSSSSPSLTFFSSVAGQMGSQTDPPYSAAKAALINFNQCAAKDLAPYGVRSNVICPGMVQTDLNRGVYEAWSRQQPEAARSTYEAWAAEKIQKVVPLNRWQKPEDSAALAVFLASNQAREITGQTMNVDGGFVMHW